ncbi:BLUF domain-containing protein [Sphingomonas rubra]|uniref:Sensors of blue-light using FAD n=1 Tax=Sphingomonas rubra TaxID=634430 RepID=A0A1I5QSW5_9SPHN|nr:BLUF domain-containing protein [Sphingomonas rubra]SFP49303.1 Sensors of blue-light using FAD [Sphingomonas rubra]
MRQLLYVSSRPMRIAVNIGDILHQSRRNNGAAGVTGLLYTDGTRFLQVIEGPEDAVDETFARIKADPRHRAVVILSDRTVTTREFGDWSMARPQDTDDEDAFDARLDRLLSGASDSVRGTFRGLVAARRAA